jgi:membrane dipeptidase
MHQFNRHIVRLFMSIALISSSIAAATEDVHHRLLVLDTHLDTPEKLDFPGFDILERHDKVADMSSVDLPRMEEGGLDGGFWVIFTSQGELTEDAYARVRTSALLRSVTIREMVARHADQFALALSHDDAAAISAEGKRVVYQSIENAYPIGTDISLLQTFYAFGVRMLGLVHTSNNQFADSSTDKSGQVWGGLSSAGRELVREANRLGFVVDASHAHDDVLEQVIELSATPVILSHSGANDVHVHPRNVGDELLLKLAASGGVIQMNSLGSYLKELEMPDGRRERMIEIRQEFGPSRNFDEATAKAYLEARRQLTAEMPAPMADFEDFMRHFLHTLALVGPKHVGVGADWDGGGGVRGMEDVSKLPRITERLLAEGYSEEDLSDIWSGNVLRLLKTAEDYANQH